MHQLVCCPRLVAFLATILLVACIMLVMDNIYLNTFSRASQRPVFFIQPLGVKQNTATVQSVSSVSKDDQPLGVKPYTSTVQSVSSDQPVSTANQSAGDLYVLSNFGSNINVSLLKERQRDAPASELKYILHWNEAYGDKAYAFGLGREPFYTHICPETRCVTTEDRHRGKSIIPT